MPKLRWILALLAIFSSLGSLGQTPEHLKQRFEDAERRIVRLPPTAFAQLPGNVVRELEHRGCTIPQVTDSKNPHNVVRGEFAKSGQRDWAVLCSRNGTSSILVFWNGSDKDPTEIAQAEDRNFLQVISEDRIGYSRAISVAGRNVMMHRYRAHKGPNPPPLDHQGIDDAFVGKASVVHYFHRGKWLELAGAD